MATRERVEASRERIGIKLAQRLLEDPSAKPAQLATALRYLERATQSPESDVDRILRGAPLNA